MGSFRSRLLPPAARTGTMKVPGPVTDRGDTEMDIVGVEPERRHHVGDEGRDAAEGLRTTPFGRPDDPPVNLIALRILQRDRGHRAVRPATSPRSWVVRPVEGPSFPPSITFPKPDLVLGVSVGEDEYGLCDRDEIGDFRRGVAVIEGDKRAPRRMHRNNGDEVFERIRSAMRRRSPGPFPRSPGTRWQGHRPVP